MDRTQRLTRQSLDRGTPVRVLRQEGLTLVVEPTDRQRRAPSGT